jgi:hypothetical protein
MSANAQKHSFERMLLDSLSGSVTKRDCAGFSGVRIKYVPISHKRTWGTSAIRLIIVSAVYRSLTDWLLNCCWPSAAGWFLVPNPTGFMVIFYCLTNLEAIRTLLHRSLVKWLNIHLDSMLHLNIRTITQDNNCILISRLYYQKCK